MTKNYEQYDVLMAREGTPQTPEFGPWGVMPDLKGWLFYPHDGELEKGGVLVHPTERGHIYLLVENRLVRVEVSGIDPRDYMGLPHAP